MNRFCGLASTFVLFGCVTAAQADTIFSDNFNADTPALNKTTFLGGWTVTNGTVDLVDFFGGRLIDLDGSSSDAGIFSKSLNLTGGVQYTASFDLAGGQRGSAETVAVSFGTTTQSYTLGATEAFSTRSLLFTPSATGSFALSFANTGGDNVGALLDNVLVVSPTVTAPVPEPTSVALMLAGLGVIVAMGRRVKANSAS